jgi:hypothetical protein
MISYYHILSVEYIELSQNMIPIPAIAPLYPLGFYPSFTFAALRFFTAVLHKGSVDNIYAAKGVIIIASIKATS